MYKKILSALALGMAVSLAQAGDPTGVINSSGTTPLPSFEEFVGPAIVGDGSVNSNNLFFIDEQTSDLGKSWYIFYEPTGNGDHLTATITFDSIINSVLYLTDDLTASNGLYGAAGITYNDQALTGLERSDSFSVAGNVLTLDIRSLNPGDHMRVFTAVTSPVPEPSTYLLLAISLVAVGLIVRRRRS